MIGKESGNPNFSSSRNYGGIAVADNKRIHYIPRCLLREKRVDIYCRVSTNNDQGFISKKFTDSCETHSVKQKFIIAVL